MPLDLALSAYNIKTTSHRWDPVFNFFNCEISMLRYNFFKNNSVGRVHLSHCKFASIWNGSESYWQKNCIFSSGTMIKFLPLDFLCVSHRVQWKNKNAVYRFQISALAPEIFKWEKCVKYANEMTDDIIHSTQYYITYINRAISVNLQHWNLVG